MPIVRRPYLALALRFAEAIHANRTHFIFLTVGIVLRSVEHVISRNGDEWDVQLGTGLRNAPRRLPIDAHGEFWFSLGLIHRRIGRGVDHQRWLSLHNRECRSIGRDKIDLPAICEIQPPVLGTKTRQRLAQMSGLAQRKTV